MNTGIIPIGQFCHVGKKSIKMCLHNCHLMHQLITIVAFNYLQFTLNNLKKCNLNSNFGVHLNFQNLYKRLHN